MKRTFQLGFWLAAVGVSLVSSACAQQDQAAPPPSAPPQASAADLEKLAAPIALHPDPLIAIILPASAYPLEIVQAARFVQDTNNIPKVDEQPWDENVKAAAKFPTMIKAMNDDLTWTMSLGQAFVQQPKELMDAIQMLRTKASSAGVLKTTPQQVVVVTNTVTQTTIEQKVVVVTNTVVQIQPSNPQVVYVPTYPPSIYYPPPAYVGPPPVLTFAAGMAVGAIIANNSCDWNGGGIYVGHHGVAVWGGGGGYHGDVDVNINRNVNVNNNVNVNSANRTSTTAQKWQPDQSRMSASGASATKSGAQTAQSRGWSSGTAQATSANRATTTTPARQAPTTAAASPRPAPPASRPTPSPSPAVASPSPGGGNSSAFGGVGGGASAQQSSQRGSASRGGGGGGGRRR